MAKGRGSNKRRQRKPGARRRKATLEGRNKLERLFERALRVQKARRKRARAEIKRSKKAATP